MRGCENCGHPREDGFPLWWVAILLLLILVTFFYVTIKQDEKANAEWCRFYAAHKAKANLDEYRRATLICGEKP